MSAELVLSCFYNPIGVSPRKLIIFRNYTYSGIASTKKVKKIWRKFKNFFAEILSLLDVFVDYIEFLA
jgi:hypothetical protein